MLGWTLAITTINSNYLVSAYYCVCKAHAGQEDKRA